jgi:hypothetical protein
MVSEPTNLDTVSTSQPSQPHLWKSLAVEWLQNAPLILGLFAGARLWHNNIWAALASLAAGGIVCALLIRFTEHWIIPGHVEPLRTVGTNALMFSILPILYVAYLAAQWSTWLSDLVIGFPAALLVAVGQDLANRDPIGWRHAFALGAAATLGLLALRLMTHVHLVIAFLTVNTLISTIITWVDYRPTPQ